MGTRVNQEHDVHHYQTVAMHVMAQILIRLEDMAVNRERGNSIPMSQSRYVLSSGKYCIFGIGVIPASTVYANNITFMVIASYYQYHLTLNAMLVY